MKEQIIAGLDIGSTAVRLVVGQRVPTDVGVKLQIIGAVSSPANGINRGVINSIEDATSSISACLEKAERLIGVAVNDVWIGINGPNLKCERSRGVVAVSRSDSEINQEDVNRAIEAAQALSVPQNYDILHVIPVEFKVDNQEFVKNPVGMTGVRLEVETLIIQNLTSQIKNLTKAIDHAGLNIEDLVFSPLAAANAVLTAKQKELGVALVNIGAATTSIAVFEEGELMHTSVLAIGSSHITSDIAIGLRCPITLAEKVKIKFGSAKSGQFGKKDEIDISELIVEENLNDETAVISQKYVAEIIEARVEEILEKIDSEFKKIDRSGMLPAGVVLIGGGARITDMVDTAKRVLRLPVALGNNYNVATVIDKVNDLEYLTALGLVVWGDQLNINDAGKRKLPLGQVLGQAKGSVKKFISIFKP
ncbi:MAG: Cell division protein ftsA [Candidatus Falkowbacteria bacterium GW2011_GWA2_39_24]|uniref:Cell division protein FtsA n=1 Tax=Candidatus Falkowbacteria bacterium GW2011_GWA2_39_24 TaxID=1618634 RepID=A0A0G0NGA9_9BACT|nr:MAG: Cell division protein ftsA [Candidatus Falkowbacteria bacterium GW2011_GWA2_39_24]